MKPERRTLRGLDRLINKAGRLADGRVRRPHALRRLHRLCMLWHEMMGHRAQDARSYTVREHGVRRYPR